MKKVFLLIGIVGLFVLFNGNAIADGGSIKDLVEGFIQNENMFISGTSETGAEYKTTPRRAGWAKITSLLELKVDESISGVQTITGRLETEAQAQAYRVDPIVNHKGQLESGNHFKNQQVEAWGYSLNEGEFFAQGPNYAFGERESNVQNLIKNGNGVTGLMIKSSSKTKSGSW